MSNYFSMVKKTGPLSKFRDGIISSWHTRFAVLTSGGLLQFKQEDMEKGKDFAKPANFKPLGDFVVTEVSEQVSFYQVSLCFNQNFDCV